MTFRQYQLPNGLRVIGEPTPTARSVAVGFFVVTGSRDEQTSESGVSHFLEHMVFKGTPRRSAMQVNLEFDQIGANYNAYTSEETTVYYAAVLPEYLPNAVDILADILRPSLRQEDFDTEKQVILEEIKMYEDSPAATAYDLARRIHFGDHPLGQSILGTTESVTGLTAGQMRAYFDRRYVAPNIVVSVAGSFHWDEFLELVEKSCGGWPSGDCPRNQVCEVAGVGGVHPIAKAGVNQEHVLMLSAGPPVESALRYASTVLAVAIGDDSGSRLYWELIDTGRAESAVCVNELAQGSGMFITSLTGEPEATGENLEIIRKVLADVQGKGITEQELVQAKNKIASRLVRAGERPMGRMQAIASSWVYLGEYMDPDTELARLDAVNLGTIREYLEKYPLDHATTVGYGPLSALG